MIQMPQVMNHMVQKMRWQASRSGVLSQNVANVETPGFQRKDIEAFRPSKGPSVGPTSFKVVESQQEMSRETEILELTENAHNYQANLSLFKKYLSFLKMVSNGRGQ